MSVFFKLKFLLMFNNFKLNSNSNFFNESLELKCKQINLN